MITTLWAMNVTLAAVYSSLSHTAAEGRSLFHGTTKQAWELIQEAGELDVSFFQHGKTSAIWAATSFESACLHMMHAARHMVQIKAAGMEIIVIEFTELSMQHKQFGQFHMWCPPSQTFVPHSAGLYCTAPHGGTGTSVVIGRKMSDQFNCAQGIKIHTVKLAKYLSPNEQQYWADLEGEGV